MCTLSAADLMTSNKLVSQLKQELKVNHTCTVNNITGILRLDIIDAYD